MTRAHIRVKARARVRVRVRVTIEVPLSAAPPLSSLTAPKVPLGTGVRMAPGASGSTSAPVASL